MQMSKRQAKTRKVRRQAIVDRALAAFDGGSFKDRLQHLVSVRSESQNPARAVELSHYITNEMQPEFEGLGFTCHILKHPLANAPFLFATRIEDAALPTVLGYGHGDVIHGLGGQWLGGLSPWELVERDERWYGRGVADNKGQHLVNITALRSVIEVQGRLGFNAKYLIEMGEEIGSPGLRELCIAHRAAFTADVLLASDGPRLQADRPLISLGTRGSLAFDLTVKARSGAHHSGNWGGLLSNPGIEIAHAIAAIVGPKGQIRVPALVPADIPPAIRAALADCNVDGGPEGPAIEAWWGEPGLTPSEKVFGWCSLEVLAFETGNPGAPVNAIPPYAFARCQLRFVVGIDPHAVIPALRSHLERHGLGRVEVRSVHGDFCQATRLDLAHPFVGWAARSIERSTGTRPNVIPNHGGTLPNDIFAEILGLPTIWVPHSYPGCSQHAPDEHVPTALIREALGIMAGLYADVAELPV